MEMMLDQCSIKFEDKDGAETIFRVPVHGIKMTLGFAPRCREIRYDHPEFDEVVRSMIRRSGPFSREHVLQLRQDANRTAYKLTVLDVRNEVIERTQVAILLPVTPRVEN